MRLSPYLSLMLCLSLLACTGKEAEQDAPDLAATTGRDGPASASAAASLESGAAEPLRLISCAEDIGQKAADDLAGVCRNVSPATHPPCNAANSCARIENEIARSCALFDGDDAPMADCKVPPKSDAAAVAVVTRYYSALNAHDYDAAWAQWGENGQPNQTFNRFKAGFAQTRSTRVTVGAVPPGEGAAGSIYVTVPVTVEATLDNGMRQRFIGEYVVRRVNDVDGASAEQLRWHIDSARLTAASAG